MAVIAWIWHQIVEFWNGLSAEGKIALLTFIATLILIIIEVMRIKKEKHAYEKESDYRLVSFKDLPKEIEIESAENLEPYIERESSVKNLNLSKPIRVLIYGDPDVGKSREALEIIGRLKKEGLRNIYLHTRSTLVSLPSLTMRRNIILFIDDLKTDFSSTEEIEIKGSISARLEKIITKLLEHDEDANIIITMQTEEFQRIKKELENILYNFKFKVVKINKFSMDEKEKYLRNLMKMFGIAPAKEDFFAKLLTIDAGPTKYYRFFRNLYENNKKYFDESDINQFMRERISDIEREIDKLPDNEKLIIETVAKFLQFSILPISYQVVIEICSMNASFPKYLKRLKIKRGIFNLDGKYFRIVNGRIVSCLRYKFPLKERRDPSLKNDLYAFANTIESIEKKISKEEAFFIFKAIAEKLHNCGMYEYSNKFLDKILSLPIEISKEEKSNFYFYKGYNYYRLGREYKKEAIHNYEGALEINKKNYLAKHALAILYHYMMNDSEKALQLLDEIIKENENDILAYKSKLEILIDIERIDSPETERTYHELEKLINKSDFSEYILAARFALARYYVKKVEILKRKGDREFKKITEEIVTPFFELLLNQIPDKLNKFKAAVKNAYGCFLYDIIGDNNGKEEGKQHLEDAIRLCPEHFQSLHKLVTILMNDLTKLIKEGKKVEIEEKEKIIREYLERILKINPDAHEAKRDLIRLDIILKKWSEVSTEEEFWNNVRIIYQRLQAIIEPETEEEIHFNNLVTHAVIGNFLKTAYIEAKNKGFKNKPSDIPFPEEEYRKSVANGRDIDFKNLKENIKRHFILMYQKLGKELIQSTEDVEKQQGLYFLKKGFRLEREFYPSLLREKIKFKEKIPLIRLMYIFYGFAPDDLLQYFEKEVNVLSSNLEVEIIKFIIEQTNAENEEHRAFLPFLILGILHFSSLQAVNKKVADLLRDQKISLIINKATIRELDKWRKIFKILELYDEVEKCNNLILEKEEKSEYDIQIKVSILEKNGEIEKAKLLMEKWINNKMKR